MTKSILRIEKFARDPITVKGIDKPSRHYFRIVAANGEIVAQSEGYTTARARNKTVRLLVEAKIEEAK